MQNTQLTTMSEQINNKTIIVIINKEKVVIKMVGDELFNLNNNNKNVMKGALATVMQSGSVMS